MELLNLLVCAGTMGYYMDILNVPLNSVPQVIDNFNTPFLTRRDINMITFPREISCSDYRTGEDGGEEKINVKCRVNFQEWNEMLHISALLILNIVLCLFIANICYTIYALVRVNKAARRSQNVDVRKFKNLTLGQRLAINLLSANIDSNTHLYLMQEIAPKVTYASSSGNTMTTPV